MPAVETELAWLDMSINVKKIVVSVVPALAIITVLVLS